RPCARTEAPEIRASQASFGALKIRVSLVRFRLWAPFLPANENQLTPTGGDGGRWFGGARNLAADTRETAYQGWVTGPMVNSLMVVSSGRSMAKATVSAMRSGAMPCRS